MAKAIARQGVKTVFGLPGHLEHFFGALQDEGCRLIHMRHESAVVMAADGYARARRCIGFACVTAGPGLANAVGGLVTAYEACTPLVLITGCNALALNDRGALQDLDHTRLVRSITKWAGTVYDASRLGEYIEMACRIALSGRPGPVVLEVLRDLPQRKVNDAVAAQALAPLVFPALALAPASDIRRAADVLMQAKRPMIIAGNGAYWGRGAAGLNTLAREFHIPVLGKALGRGLVPEDHEVGFSWPIAHHAAREADVVLLAGSRLGSVVCYGAPPFFREDVRFIQVNIDAAEIGRDRLIEAPVAGDCGPALEAIAAELARRSHKPRDPRWMGEAIAATRARFDELGHEETGMVHPLRMARELAKRMPKEAIFVGDGANSLNWLKAVLRVRSSPGWMDHDPFGSMGVGLPLAIGAVAAQQESGSSRPVFLGTGDGAFGQYLGELATASLHGLPMFIMVANDGCWGASRNIEMRLLGRMFGVELNQSRYDLVAQGLECHGELAASPADVAPAFDRALAAVRDGKPALVNVLVDQKMGDKRADPQLQTMPFNHEWFFARQGN